MAGPFKMKGSPMQRNFGISPAKHAMDKRGFKHGDEYHSETVSDDSGTGHKLPLKNRITDLTGMDEKQLQNANAHNNAHAGGKLDKDHNRKNS